MTRALVVSLLLLGCKGTHAPPRTSTPDLALPAGWSRGFGAAPSTPAAPAPPPPPITDSDDDDAVVALPPEMAKRPAPREGVALYVDGAAKPPMTLAELASTKRLDAIAGPTARSVFAHGATGNLWLTASELQRYQLRLNRRGQVKLEPIDAAGGGSNRDKAGHDAPPEHAGRAHELREIEWLEIRTRASAHVSGEP